jgi:hypothetical protein
MLLKKLKQFESGKLVSNWFDDSVERKIFVLLRFVVVS